MPAISPATDAGFPRPAELPLVDPTDSYTVRDEHDAPAASVRTIKVLLVDDHEVVRIGLRQLIDAYPDLHVCGEATTLTEARTAIEMLKPDLVLLDVTLESENGFDLLRSLDSLRHAPRVLVLSMQIGRAH